MAVRRHSCSAPISRRSGRFCKAAPIWIGHDRPDHRLHGHDKGFDSHRATDVRSQLTPLKKLAERTEVCFSAVTHPPKNASTRAHRSVHRLAGLHRRRPYRASVRGGNGGRRHRGQKGDGPPVVHQCEDQYRQAPADAGLSHRGEGHRRRSILIPKWQFERRRSNGRVKARFPRKRRSPPPGRRRRAAATPCRNSCPIFWPAGRSRERR